jgi:hypothetical protein
MPVELVMTVTFVVAVINLAFFFGSMFDKDLKAFTISSFVYFACLISAIWGTLFFITPTPILSKTIVYSSTVQTYTNQLYTVDNIIKMDVVAFEENIYNLNQILKRDIDDNTRIYNKI